MILHDHRQTDGPHLDHSQLLEGTLGFQEGRSGRGDIIEQADLLWPWPAAPLPPEYALEVRPSFRAIQVRLILALPSASQQGTEPDPFRFREAGPYELGKVPIRPPPFPRRRSRTPHAGLRTSCSKIHATRLPCVRAADLLPCTDRRPPECPGLGPMGLVLRLHQKATYRAYIRPQPPPSGATLQR